MTIEEKIKYATEQKEIAADRLDEIGYAYWKGYKEALEEVLENDL